MIAISLAVAIRFTCKLMQNIMHMRNVLPDRVDGFNLHLPAE